MPARIIYQQNQILHPESKLSFVKDVDGFNPRKALFLCECGNEKLIDVNKVKNCTTKSCGCFKESLLKTHGMNDSREYKSWEGMIQRVTNKNSPSYKNYGGRGISICDKWLKFEDFYKDMGNRPEGTSIDRLDNDGNYEPGNCRWSTNIQQARNTMIRNDNRSGCAGVSWYKERKKWHARISAAGKIILLGYFTNLEDAISARKSAELKFWN